MWLREMSDMVVKRCLMWWLREMSGVVVKRDV
jgi:hypothetical protein